MFTFASHHHWQQLVIPFDWFELVLREIEDIGWWKLMKLPMTVFRRICIASHCSIVGCTQAEPNTRILCWQRARLYTKWKANTFWRRAIYRIPCWKVGCHISIPSEKTTFLFVVASGHFSETTIRHQVNSVNVRINVYFSYKKKTKEIYYFLKIDDHMIILGKFDKHFVVSWNEIEYIFAGLASLPRTFIFVWHR